MECVVVGSGWCACWLGCRGVGVECVRFPDIGELCVACGAAEMGLPEGASAGEVVAEWVRRAGPSRFPPGRSG